MVGDDAPTPATGTLFHGSDATDAARAGQARRLAAARGLPSLDRLAALAARLVGARSAQVSLIAEVQVVVGGAGDAAPAVGTESAAADSLCTVTVRADAPLAVRDARADDRVAHLPPVTSGAVGSYLGVPLVAAGHTVGALCVFDATAREWSAEQVALLEMLAAPIVTELELAALETSYEDDRLVWQVAVDSAGVGAFEWNLLTGELRWDDRLLELFGHDRTSFGGTIEAFNACVHPDDRDRVGRALAGAIDTCGEYAAEYRIVLPDAGVRWVSARGRALPGPDATAVRVLGAAYDTTAVQDGEARVARVMEAMPTAFYHLDRDWRFTYANGEAERLLVGTGQDLVGEVVWELFPATVGSIVESSLRGAVATGVPVTFEAHHPAPLEGWFEIRAWPTPDGLSVYFIDISARHEAQDTLVRAADRAQLLAAVTDALTDTLDAGEAVARLARIVVPTLGDWCVVTRVDALGPTLGADWRRGLRDVGWWHADPALRPLVERYAGLRLAALSDASFIAEALRSQRPVLVAENAGEAIAALLADGEARELFRRLDPTSAVVVPLRGRGRTVGLLTAFRAAGSPPFSEADLATFDEAAGRAGLALDNARLYVEQRELAETLQRSLMTAPPESDDLHVVVRYVPAAETAQVGGDWYDAFRQPDGSTVVVIGDVVGHDTAAAAAMGQLRSVLRGIAATTGAGPAEVLHRVDGAMATLEIDTTATVVVARIEHDDGGALALRWSNAGHPPPVVVRAAGGESEVLWGAEPNLLLGLTPDAVRAEARTALPPGSTVLLYTDGLVESRAQSLDVGLDRLAVELADLVGLGLGLDELADELLRRLLPERPDDDVAIVVVRVETG